MVLVVCTGCAQQRLAMMDARSDPAKLSPGDESIICVRVIDTQGVVAAVTATVREYNPISLDLNDSGEEGDEVAGDGVWSIAFEVPGEADTGQYNWDFEAFDDNSDPVKVTTEKGAEEPLTAEAPVEVLY
ncbi:MAG: hypothetical protein ACYS21_13240 [Planctomycetota bacterium]|jgi:hypothetical protein